MNREMLMQFQGKPCKIVLAGNFVLTGIINTVYDDAILFTTHQKTSLIVFSRIQEITPVERQQ